MSDLTLISKISNEAINENLKKRFENAEIYVRKHPTPRQSSGGKYFSGKLTGRYADIHWPCVGLCQSVPRLYV